MLTATLAALACRTLSTLLDASARRLLVVRYADLWYIRLTWKTVLRAYMHRSTVLAEPGPEEAHGVIVFENASCS
jgi:hypothetical protein